MRRTYLSDSFAREICAHGGMFIQWKKYELGRRLLVTVLILALYMLGRTFLLYRVDPAAYQLEELNSQNIIVSMVSGERYRLTVFALGIMPYITSNLMIWFYIAIRGSDFKSRTTPQRTERWTLALMLAVSAMSAVSRAGDLVFIESLFHTTALKTIAVLEMVTGAFVIYKMADVNKLRGIGGQTPIVLVNVVDNLISTVRKFTWQELQKPVILCLVMAAMILLMENVMIRIPVQRVSIHNIYADQSYIAFKLDPIGVMPVMFAISFFMIPQTVVRFFLLINEDSQTLRMIYEKLNLNDVVGTSIYLGIIFTLNILFSFIMLTPGEVAEQLQRLGDSIVGVYAGRKTKWYLRRTLLLLSLCSGCILCLLMGSSLWLALRGEILPELALFPASAMILTGIVFPMFREVKAYIQFDSYSFFV